MQMLRKLVKEKNMPPFELVLLPHVTDNENNGYIENSYATARNKRIKVRTARNALHPREWGYQQGADALYCWMKYMLHKEEQTAKAVKK